MTIDRRGLLTAAAFAWPSWVRAQTTLPRQSIRFVGPFAPGGPSTSSL